MDIIEIKFRCNKCGKEQTYKNINIVSSAYNQYVVDIYDQGDENFEGNCECEYERA